MTTYTLKGHWVVAQKYCARYDFTALQEPFNKVLPILRRTLPPKIVDQMLKASPCEFKIPFITLQDSNYPKLLKDIPYAPPVLFYKGALELLNRQSIAIVGTRKSSTQANLIAAEFSTTLSQKRTIVSGLAYGIDKVAHLNALPNTIGVCGQGLSSSVYGYRKNLHARILSSGGLLVSEFPPHQPPQKWTYVQRNRTIAGLANSLLVIEAPLKSGALISAENALNFGRDVYVVPSHPYHKQGQGSLKLLYDGALFAIKPSDIITDIEQIQNSHPLFQLLETPMNTEEIVELSQWPLQQVQTNLFELQGKGLIVQKGPYWHRRT
jgi:DNA processing protein